MWGFAIPLSNSMSLPAESQQRFHFHLCSFVGRNHEGNDGDGDNEDHQGSYPDGQIHFFLGGRGGGGGGRIGVWLVYPIEEASASTVASFSQGDVFRAMKKRESGEE